MQKFLNYLALFTSIGIAGIAAYFSVLGLATIFAGAFLGIVIMAGTLEFGKLVTAAYLHLFWDKLNYMKYYLTTAVVVLMLITSLGIFGYLAKASSDTSYATAQAQSEVVRIDQQIGREQNRIDILEQRKESLSTGTFDVSSSVASQIEIRDGAWDRVQGDIDFAQGQINSLRTELTALDTAVNELRDKGVVTITTNEGVFNDEVQVIDYVAQAQELYNSQLPQRQQIRDDIAVQQGNIDRYRLQAQDTINGANAEINRLNGLTSTANDDIIKQTDEIDDQIEGYLDTIAELRDEKFIYEQEVLNFQREVGPIQYLAEIIYGEDNSMNYIDNAIRWVIYALIFVFDPLAVLLLITSAGLLVNPKTGMKRPPVSETRYVIQMPKNKVLDLNKDK